MSAAEDTYLYEKILERPGVEKLLGNIIVYHPITRTGKKFFYNVTLFEDFCGIKHSKNFNYTQLRHNCSEKLESLMAELQKLEEKMSNNYIFHQALDENIITLQFLKNGLEFELLKAGARITISERDYANKLKLQEIYEAKLYGGKIIDHPFEAGLCLHEIIRAYKSHKERLSKHEQAQYKTYISIINQVLEERWYTIHSQKTPYKKYHAQTKIFLKRYGRLPIQRQLYTEIFQKSLNILWLSHINIIHTDWNWFSVGKNEFRIPSWSRYDEISLGKMFRLIYHEIVWHLLNWKNHQACFYDIRGKGSIMKEEWVAMLLENIMLWESFQNLDLKPASFCRILAWEILEGWDFRSFIRLRKKLLRGKVFTTTATFLRHKIWYPRYQIGVQHKDVTYVRWLIEVMNYIKKWWNPRALFSGKFWLQDIASGRCDFSDASEFQAPLPIIDIIIYAIMSWNDSPADGQLKLGEDFRFFLLDKYGPCFSMFADMWNISQEQNNQLLHIIKTVKARKLYGRHKIKYQPIENMMIEHNREIRNIIQ